MKYLYELKYSYPFLKNLPNEMLPFVTEITTNNIVEKNTYSFTTVRNISSIWNSIFQFNDKDIILTPAFPRGNAEADIMIVGQNPGGRGKEDSRYTVIWNDGPNSKFFLNCVEEAGIFQNVWFTNLFLFPTPDNRITKEQVDKTMHLFDLQVEKIKPKVFIGLGKTVCHYLKNNKFDIPVIEVPHPAYVRRFLSGDKKNRENYIDSLSSAKTYTNLLS